MKNVLMQYEVWQGEDFIDVFDAYDSKDAIEQACIKYEDLDKDTLKSWDVYNCPMPPF